MSRVFVAEETALGRKVVVQGLHPDLVAGVNVDRFRREIQVAARLQQAQIVPLLAAGEIDGIPHYSMPFVEGESLRARVDRGDPLSISEVVSILRDVARALARQRSAERRKRRSDSASSTRRRATQKKRRRTTSRSWICGRTPTRSCSQRFKT